jgi:hypothetical protein
MVTWPCQMYHPQIVPFRTCMKSDDAWALWAMNETISSPPFFKSCATKARFDEIGRSRKPRTGHAKIICYCLPCPVQAETGRHDHELTSRAMHALKKMACTGYVHETTIQTFDFLDFVDIAIAWSAAVYSLLMQLQVGNALTRASDALENIKRTLGSSASTHFLSIHQHRLLLCLFFKLLSSSSGKQHNELSHPHPPLTFTRQALR